MCSLGLKSRRVHAPAACLYCTVQPMQKELRGGTVGLHYSYRLEGAGWPSEEPLPTKPSKGITRRHYLEEDGGWRNEEPLPTKPIQRSYSVVPWFSWKALSGSHPPALISPAPNVIQELPSPPASPCTPSRKSIRSVACGREDAWTLAMPLHTLLEGPRP